MANVYGTLFDNGGAVYNVKHTDYGAVGNGSTDDTAAIQAAINAAEAAGGGTVYFPRGRYKITAALTLDSTSFTDIYNGITFRGVGYSFEASAANNKGSVIQLDTSTDSVPAFKLGSSTGGDYPLLNVHFYNLGIQATNTAWNGNLVWLYGTGKSSFQDCGFAGPVQVVENVETATAASLIYGTYWVDLHFVGCRFSTAVKGVEQHSLGSAPTWQNSTNNVSFERCVFERLGTSIDINTAASNTALDRCTFEPTIAGAASTVVLGGDPVGAVRDCWFGDSDNTGTWLQISGVGTIVEGNAFSHAAVGIELVLAAYDVEIKGNYFTDCNKAVLAASNGLKMRGNFIYLPNGVSSGSPAIGLDLSGDPAARVEYNRILNSSGSPANTVGYRLASGTGGELEDLVGSGPVTLIQNSATASWTTRVGAVVTYSSGATVNVANLVATGAAAFQAWITMTGSVGSPATSTRFISDAGSSDTFYHNVPSGGSFLFADAGSYMLQLTRSATADDDTALIVMRRKSGSWSAQRVSEGIADSGGTGFRVLRIPN